MKPEAAMDESGAQVDELLAWHTPQIQSLSVGLDTAIGPGSSGDLAGFDPGTDPYDPSSDRRLKKDISTIQGALTGVLSLQGVTYRYDTAKYPEMGLRNGPQIGFIAQDLEQVYPELVTTKENGFKAVNYAQLVPALVEAIKEQQSMIADLQEQVNALQHAAKVVVR
jgi:hypothetical protein